MGYPCAVLKTELGEEFLKKLNNYEQTTDAFRFRFWP